MPLRRVFEGPSGKASRKALPKASRKAFVNTDIRIKTTFFDHIKTRRLQERLGPEGVLSLIKLWCAVAVHKPSGILKGWRPEDIAYYAGWQGSAKEFVNSLVDIGFVDKSQTGGRKNQTAFRLHGWQTHNKFAAKAKERSAIAKQNAKAGWEKRKQACESHADGKQTAMQKDADGNAPSPSPKRQRKDKDLSPLIPPSPEQCSEHRRNTGEASDGRREGFYEKGLCRIGDVMPALNRRSRL
jgi:hypothetical protein